MWEHPVFEPDEEYCSTEDGGPDAFGYEAYFKEMQQKREVAVKQQKTTMDYPVIANFRSHIGASDEDTERKEEGPDCELECSILGNHISCIRKKEKEVPGQGNLPMLVQ
eukprot:XP_019080115.1 PREDICTED: uncharacterized protein LOC109123771 isoform X1 [Vitis vinifera]